tara:strand:- start:146 stop:355 length:210 start_codon:yes stop_codon:yes gene_type:complete
MTLNEDQITALVHIILYLHEEERADQEECGCEDHMFFNVEKLKDALQNNGIDMDNELKMFNEITYDKET